VRLKIGYMVHMVERISKPLMIYCDNTACSKFLLK